MALSQIPTAEVAPGGAGPASGTELLRPANEYAELKRLLRQQGLFKRQPAFYAYQAVLIVGLLTVSVGILVLAPFWAKMLDALLLAFTFTQIGYIGHDAGHRQIFARPFQNDMVGLLVGLLLGASRSWWVEIHNDHHSNPNDLALDPHTAIPAISFTAEQARSKRGFIGRVTRFQAIYFYPMLLFEGLGLRAAGIQYLAGKKAKFRLLEASSIVLHFAAYLALVFSVMSLGQAALFLALHQGIWGLYLGSIFAPNHKGMLVPDTNTDLDFLRLQVLTTRNIKPHPLTDFWCGGLNYQIEHHLFPNLPRNKLKAARLVIMDFCRDHSIPYYETGFLQSYVEVTRYLAKVAAPA